MDVEQMNELTKDIPVKAIVAVGIDGQIGLNGGLPWDNVPELKEVRKKDLLNFREKTTDCVVVVGRNTWSSVSHLDNTHNRTFLINDVYTYIIIDQNMKGVSWDFWVPKYIAHTRAEQGIGKREVWIAGGAKTYKKWLPYLDELHINEITYHGPADTYLPIELHLKNIDQNKTKVFITPFY